MRFDGLTAQQLRVAKLVAEGWTDKAIGDKTGIEPATVRFHIRRIAKVWDLSPEKVARVEIARRVARFTNAA
jgi:DNA-binding NarL/FixJ family response regulator